MTPPDEHHGLDKALSEDEWENVNDRGMRWRLTRAPADSLDAHVRLSDPMTASFVVARTLKLAYDGLTLTH
jgi:hypothetical protein